MATVNLQTEQWTFTEPTRATVTLQTEKWTFTPPTRATVTLQTELWNAELSGFTPRVMFF